MENIMKLYSELCRRLKVFPHLSEKQRADLSALSEYSYSYNTETFIETVCKEIKLYSFFQPLPYLIFTSCSSKNDKVVFAINSWHSFTYILNKDTDEISVIDADFEFVYSVAKTQAHFQNLFKEFLEYEIEFSQTIGENKTDLTNKYIKRFISASGGDKYKDYLLFLFPSHNDPDI